MTRPKVPEDKRQRIAQACDTCKRRKQKCNGLQPCNPCTKRNAHCTYSATEPPGTDNLSPFRPPFKRRHVETAAELGSHHDLLANLASGGQDDDMESQMLDDFGPGSHQITPFGQDEETHVYGQPRLLQDPTGRLLFVGDSANLSYLQAIRTIVEGVAGPSQFTMDPDRHKFTEPTLMVPETARNIHMLPEKKAADVLVQYFFTNTHGLMDILDRREFKQSLNLCYSSPLTVESSDLCLVYLVLAIGLAMASPIPGSPEHEIVIHLRSQPVDQAEVFFRSAKGLGDPVSGFEDGNFWSIQALCLMSVYMLAVSKRNAAYAYLGMAVRSAYALGLHRPPETAMIFTQDQLPQRRNVWRSLFVLDRFLAVSLGRPVAISEDECSEDSLEAPTKPLGNKRMRRNQTINSSGLDAGVQASKIISEVLKKVYSKKKISTAVAQEIVDACKHWANDIHPALDSDKLFNRDIAPAQGMAILHIQLLGCHTIILLTRPFFLHSLIKSQTHKPGSQVQIDQQNSRIEMFSESCVAASIQAIKLTQAVFQSRKLPQRHPFVMHFLFAATLTILSNEFARPHGNADYDESVSNAMTILSYFSANDVQASQLLSIVASFRDVVQGRVISRVPGGSAQTSHTMYLTKMPVRFSKDVIESLVSSHQHSRESESNAPKSPRLHSEKSISQVSQAPMNPQERSLRGMKPPDPAAQRIVDSPTNSTASLSQPTEISDQQGSDPGGTGSIESEHGFHFDSFWGFENDTGSISCVQTPGTGSRVMAQIQPAETGGNAMGYSHYSAPGIPDAPQNQSHGVVSNPVSIYPLENPSEFGR